MKHYIPTLAVTLLSISPTWAKTCTEQDIRDSIAAKNRFVYSEEGCTNPNGIIFIAKGIFLTGEHTVVDGENVMRLQWSGEGSCTDEIPRNSDFTFFAFKGGHNTVKRFSAEGAPEGLHIDHGDGNLIEDVTFPYICEDAITNGVKKPDSATNSVIRRVHFNQAPDKAIQVNGGSVTVERCVFRDVPRSIGMCSVKADPGIHPASDCKVPSKIWAIQNDIDGCRGYAIRTAGKDGAKGGVVIADGNVIKNCKVPFRVEEEGYLEIKNNWMGSGCRYAVTVDSLGTALYGCGNNANACSEGLANSSNVTFASCH